MHCDTVQSASADVFGLWEGNATNPDATTYVQSPKGFGQQPQELVDHICARAASKISAQG